MSEDLRKKAAEIYTLSKSGYIDKAMTTPYTAVPSSCCMIGYSLNYSCVCPSELPCPVPVKVEKGYIQSILHKHLVTPKYPERVLVLNFASFHYPGGGFLCGAIAQEEALCQCSNLYFALEQMQSSYYNRHKCNESTSREYRYLYDDDSIYTQNVTLLRDKNGNELDKVYMFDVLTTAAPNKRAYFSDQFGSITLKNTNGMLNLLELNYKKALYNRVQHIFSCLQRMSCMYDTVIFGAFGCGVFGNKAEDVSKVFADILHKSPVLNHVCKEIVFAVPDEPNKNNNYAVFYKRFNNFH